LENFHGAKRRFETKGRVDGVWVVDDYAHHPTEVKATLKAAKQTKPNRLICVFQPHRYTRTKLLLEEFSTAFVDCDELILADIYSAGEDPIAGITSEFLAAKVGNTTKQNVKCFANFEAIEKYLESRAQKGDLIMTIGAGDVYRIGESLVTELKRR
jgi:UDP-N-acetylmuramate-alanine ligase